jgi:hypothetical protein
MTLFRYLQDKDMFEAFYKKNLAKRLLLGAYFVYVACACVRKSQFGSVMNEVAFCAFVVSGAVLTIGVC